MKSTILKALLIVTAGAQMTGCATSIAKQEYQSVGGFGVYDTSRKLEIKERPVRDGNLFSGLALMAISGGTAGLDSALTNAGLYFYGNSAPDERHSAWNYVPGEVDESLDRADYNTYKHFTEVTRTLWNQAVKDTAKEFDLEIVETSTIPLERGNMDIHVLHNPDMGCDSNSKRNHCTVVVQPGVHSTSSRKGFVSPTIDGENYPQLKINSRFDGKLNQLELYKALSTKLPNTYIFLSADERVWLGNQMALTRPVIVHKGEIMEFKKP